MESQPHTLMDGTDRAAGSAPGRLALLKDRILGRRRTYLVDPSYQVRSAIIAVLGMAFLLVFAGALVGFLEPDRHEFYIHALVVHVHRLRPGSLPVPDQDERRPVEG